VRRLGLILVSLFLACWIFVVLDRAGVLSLAGSRPQGFYRVYGLAAFLGSVGGYVFSYRSRRLSLTERGRLLALSLVLPLGAVFLLRSFAPVTERAASPLVPALSIVIYGVFFAVPVSIGRHSP
jgi:hypothetical protein